MKSTLLPVWLVVFSFIAIGQVELTPIREDLSDRMHVPAKSFKVENLTTGTYRFNLELPHSFSCFGIGWKTNHDVTANEFNFTYRTKKRGEDWSMWISGDADFTPAEIPSGHYRTDAWFTHDASSHDYIEIIFTHPVDVEEVILSLFDGNLLSDSENDKIEAPITQKTNRVDCPQFPEIITRAEWCGGSAPCNDVLAGYTPTTITPTHVVMHHGASPNTYTDAQAVVRSYWNYHVNTLNWADIGYNYLIDKYGNFYQGRHNPNLPYTDVRGAHAGAANNGSIGLNFLGNLDVSIATTAQLQKLYELLAWWFDYKEIDVLGSSGMTTQAYGWQIQPHFTHHNALNPTTCPGTDMISRMQSIREATHAIIEACADNIPPTTLASTTYDWRGTDFTVTFEDNDNVDGSGVTERYVQILHYNGNEWRAQPETGQFNDNFDNTIHPDWIQENGSWAIENEKLVQTDEASGNTNLFIELTQNNTKTYLYQWEMELLGTGNNRRGGLHFFVDDPTLPNRGNNYLAWFRADDNAFQFYRNENDALNMVVNNPVTIDVNTTYDCKVTYNPTNGRVQAFLNDELVGEYIDSNPLSSGQYISLRNGNSTATFDNMKVRTSRGESLDVTVGPESDNLAPFESPNPTEDACRINTIVKDGANNWSVPFAKQVYIDWTAPETQISGLPNPITTDFQVAFTDEDNEDGSGVDRRFYAVSDFDGTEWRSNHSRGYLTDFFDDEIHSDWTIQEGDWTIDNGQLNQTDESINNTNIYAPLNQQLSNRYLYHFDMRISGSGTNRRAGFHYFCDQPALTNRGNSYFVWFRLDLQTLEFYRVENDVFTQEKVVSLELEEAVNYAVDIVYDRITGETFVYLNRKLVGEWQDANPITTGDYVSFRSGNSIMHIDNFKTFRTRFPEADITIGDVSSDIRYEDLNTPTGKISSVVIDLAHNLSTVVDEEIIVYWSEIADLGLPNAVAEHIQLYPNPSNGEVTVEFFNHTSNNMAVKLYDMQGRLVFEEAYKLETGINKLSLPLTPSLAQGSYNLMLEQAGEQTILRLIRK